MSYVDVPTSSRHILIRRASGLPWPGDGGGVAPVLSAASAADFSDVFVWGQATTDTASGTLYAVVVASAAATPSAAQIVAGTDAAGVAAPNGSVAITSIGVKQVLVRGLTTATSYKVCMTHQAAGQNSNVVTVAFTTDTLILALATSGAATGLSVSTGSAAFGLNQADPHGGTNAIRWTDNNDAATGLISVVVASATYFSGQVKVHMTVKHGGGSQWIRLQPTSMTTVAIVHFNASTGAIGTEAWVGTPVTYDVATGWKMFSGVIDMTGADIIGTWTVQMCLTDNVTNTSVRNGTNIKDLYNLRFTRISSASPLLSAASAVNFSDVFVWGQATTDTASGTLYAVVCPAAAAVPSAAQVKAGTDGSGVAATSSANIAIASTGVKNVLLHGLTATTAYVVYMTHEGAALSNVVSGSFTTDTLVASFATAGAATGITTSTGSAALGLNQADPFGGTTALRWVDTGDATPAAQVLITCAVPTFFNGVNKFFISTKVTGGAAFVRSLTALITTLSGQTNYNGITGAIGTNVWSPTPVIFDMSVMGASAAGWWMFTGSANCAGADVTGTWNFNKCGIDGNVNSVTRDGTNIGFIHNIRITRV